MANFSALKTAIQNAIKQNGNEEITGNVLQQILLSIVSSMGDGAINTIEQNLSSETLARQNGDNTLQSNINAEAGARQSADNTLQSNIDAEALARGNADTQLQNAINAIKANIDNGYVYAGIATPSTTPVSGKVFYIATAAGTYTNFGGQVLTQGINILRFDGSAWSNQQLIGIDDVPTAGSNNLVKSSGVQNELALGAVYDVSAKNPTAGPNNDGKWESLSALLSDANLNTLIPTAYRKGGMSIKFVHTNDNKYVQFHLMSQSFSTTVTDWQSENMDSTPINGSKNPVESGGVFNEDMQIKKEQANSVYEYESKFKRNESLIQDNDVLDDVENSVIIGESNDDYIASFNNDFVELHRLPILDEKPLASKNINVENTEIDNNIEEQLLLNNRNNDTVFGAFKEGVRGRFIKNIESNKILPYEIIDGKNVKYTGGEIVETTSQYWYYNKYDVSLLTKIFLFTVNAVGSSNVPFFIAIKNNEVIHVETASKQVCDELFDVSEYDEIYVNVAADNHLNVLVESVENEIFDTFNNLFEKDNILFMGDSIMQGVGAPIGYNCSFFCKKLLKANGIDIGIGGTHMALKNQTAVHFPRLIHALTTNDWTFVDNALDGETEDLFVYTKSEIAKIKQATLANIDIVVIAYGYNDWRFSSTLDNPNNLEDETTCLGALRSGIRQLLETNPLLRIYVFTPSYASGWDTLYQGMTLKEYGDKIAECSLSLNIPCKNQFNLCNVNSTNRERLYKDGVHRNIIGYRLLGEQYAKFIKSN